MSTNDLALCILYGFIGLVAIIGGLFIANEFRKSAQEAERLTAELKECKTPDEVVALGMKSIRQRSLYW